MNILRICVYAVAAVAAGSVLLWLASPDDKNGGTPRAYPQSGSVTAETTLHVDNIDVATKPAEEVSESPVKYPTRGAETQHYDMMRGAIAIDEYIREHLEDAEAGDAESAYYVADAMSLCRVVIAAFDRIFSHYRSHSNQFEAGPEEMARVMMQGIVGQPEPYRREMRRQADKAIGCKKLGFDDNSLSVQAAEWLRTAASRGHPIARAQLAALDPANPPADPEQLASSLRTMRDVLSTNRDLTTLLYAASVVSANTGREYVTERVAWALLACEYKECDSLNYGYRISCANMAMSQSVACSEEMSDREYLFLRYPEYFDAARARMLIIQQALRNSDWTSIGLE